MAERMIKSSLSDEEIRANFENVDFFSGIMTGLEEALCIRKGCSKSGNYSEKTKSAGYRCGSDMKIT